MQVAKQVAAAHVHAAVVRAEQRGLGSLSAARGAHDEHASSVSDRVAHGVENAVRSVALRRAHAHKRQVVLLQHEPDVGRVAFKLVEAALNDGGAVVRAPRALAAQQQAAAQTVRVDGELDGDGRAPRAVHEAGGLGGAPREAVQNPAARVAVGLLQPVRDDALHKGVAHEGALGERVVQRVAGGGRRGRGRRRRRRRGELQQPVRGGGVRQKGTQRRAGGRWQSGWQHGGRAHDVRLSSSVQ